MSLFGAQFRLTGIIFHSASLPAAWVIFLVGILLCCLTVSSAFAQIDSGNGMPSGSSPFDSSLYRQGGGLDNNLLFPSGTDSAAIRQRQIDDSLRALRGDSLRALYGGDSLRFFTDSLRALSDSAAALPIDTTYVIYLDSTSRLQQFFYHRRDNPSVEVFPAPNYSLYGTVKSPAYKRDVTLDSTGQFVTIRETVNGRDVKVPITLTLEEYIQHRFEYEKVNNWRTFTRPYTFKENRDALGGVLSSLTNIDIPVPPNPIFSIFGGDKINLRISGGVDIRGGFRRQSSDQVTINAQDQVRNEPDFNQEVRVNVDGTIGDKLNIHADWNTERTFEYENQLKIKYTGYDDEIIQSIEAGNVSLQTPALVGGGQALFGIKANMQAGPLKLTTLLSQKKGQTKEFSISGGAEKRTVDLTAEKYSQNYYFVDTVYRRFWDQLHEIVPTVTDEMTGYEIIQIDVWKTQFGNQDQVRTTEVFAHTDIGPRPSGGYPANIDAILTTNDVSKSHEGRYIRLEPNKDYRYDRMSGYIVILTNLTDQDAIAVSYTTQGSLSVQAQSFGDNPNDPADTTSSGKLILKLIKPPSLWNNPSYQPAWDLMLKNIYPLGGRDLKREGFELKILRSEFAGADQNDIVNYPLLQVLGMDRFNANNDPAPDQIFDFIPGKTVDIDRAEIIFPTLEPFGAGIANFLQEKNVSQSEIDSFQFPQVYDTTKLGVQNSAKNRYIIRATFSSSQRAGYSLGFNVVEGSVQVLLNGSPLTQNTDYTVDYITGEVVIRNPQALVPGANVQVKYEQNDLFQLASKTLIGARGELALIPNTNLGFTIMNLNQATLSDKVRLGDEPTNNTIVGTDLSSQFNLPFLTSMVDALPMLRTREMSSMRFSAEAAYMMPDPNTKKSSITEDAGSGIAFIDDFEGSRRTIPFPVIYSGWQLASPPLLNGNVSRSTDKKARLLWYNRLPSDVSVKEIWPDREVRRGQEAISLLNLDFDPNRRGMYNFATNPNLNVALSRDVPEGKRENWAGVMRYIAGFASGIVEQNMSYIEIWMKISGSDSVDLQRGRLYIDLGRINENVITEEGNNSRLNSEDLILQNPGNGILNEGEDLGLDMIADDQERVVYSDFLSANSGDSDVDPNDPSGDNWSFGGSRTDFSHINGSEKNSNSAEGRYPNTEDLSNNAVLDQVNDYLEYEVPLTPIYLDSTGGQQLRNEYIVGGGAENNYWYQFRIPILEPTRIMGGSVSPQSILQNVQIVRMWLSGFREPVSIRIAEVGLVGNQWEERIRGDSVLKASVVNIEDNPNYTSPPGVIRERDRSDPNNIIQGNEQSLSLLVRGLGQSESRAVVRRFVTRPLDLFNYGSMKMFVHGDPTFAYLTADRYDAEIFVQFGADSFNYYEYRAPIRPRWDPLNNITIKFSDLTSVKASRDSVNQIYRIPVDGGPPGATYGVRGNPSLRQIREIVIGVTNPDGPGSRIPLNGDVWVNELRLVDVDDSPGIAYRFDTQVKLADFGNIGFNFSQTDPNFHSLTERFGSRNTTVNWAINSSFALDQFFPDSWQGTSIPFGFSHTENIVKPRYLPNTDVVVAEAASRARDNQTGGTETSQPDAGADVIKASQTLRVQNSYSVPNFRIGLPSQAWYIRDTFNKLGFSFNYNTTSDRDPSITYRKTWQWNGRVAYTLALPPYFLQPFEDFEDAFFLDAFSDMKIYYVPFVSLNAGVGTQRGRTTELSRVANAIQRDTRMFSASRSFGFGWKLIEGGLLPVGGEYSLQTDRNLAPFDNDSVGRGFASLLKTIFLRGQDSRYGQRVTWNTKPKLPNIFDIPRYLDLNAGYSVNYSWQNSFQKGDAGKSAGWDNNINLSMNFKLKSLADKWFEDNERGTTTPRSSQPRNRDREGTVGNPPAGSDSTRKGSADSTESGGGASFGKLFDQLKLVSKVLIKVPLLDYESINISFTQTNRSINTSVVGSTGFQNFWGRLPFTGSRIENGPSRLYQLGLISDPSGTLRYSPSSSFPFIGWETIPGRRAANSVTSNQFSQSNNITLRTNRPLWMGATLDINWKVGWQLAKTTPGTANADGDVVLGVSTTQGNVERSFLTLPPVLFFKVFKSNLEDVGKKYDELQAADVPDNVAIAESFEKGLEALPFLNKLFGKYVPRPNWTFRWDGIEKVGGIKSVVERLSLEHSYTSSFRRDFRNVPGVGEQTDVERVTYGFSPLAGINASFQKFLKGSLSGTVRYNTTTTYDLNIVQKSIFETVARDISLSLTYSRKGFSFPLFGLNLSNDFDMSFTLSQTRNARRQYNFALLISNPEGTPIDGNTRTTYEPRIRYVLSSRVSAAVFYRYSKIAPDEGGSFIYGTTTNEAGLDIHISI